MSKLQKRLNLEKANEEIIEIEDEGHQVERFTDYHWRIEGIDVWPSSRKFMKRKIINHYKHLKDIFNF